MDQPLSDEQRLLLIQFEQYLNSFFAHLDGRCYDEMLTHFTANARWFRQGKWSEGHAAIRAELEARSPKIDTCHVMSNHYIASADPTHIRVDSVMTAYRFEAVSDRDTLPVITAPLRINLVSTVFEKVENGMWLISEQKFAPKVAFKDS